MCAGDGIHLGCIFKGTPVQETCLHCIACFSLGTCFEQWAAKTTASALTSTLLCMPLLP